MFFRLLQRFATLFHLFHLLWGLFLAELILFYYQIVHSSTTKIYFDSPFIRRLMRSFSCRTRSMLLLNFSFLYYKDLLLYYIYFTSYEVYFMQKSFYYIIKLFFPLLQRFASLFHLFYILWGLFLVEPILCYYQIVLSSTTKICYFIHVSLLMRSFSSKTNSILLSNCSFLYNKYLLLYYIYFTSH